MLFNHHIGGALLAGSLVTNDWPSPGDLVFGNGTSLSGWMLDLDLIAPSSIDVSDKENQEYWGSILASVQAKASAPMSVVLVFREASSHAFRLQGYEHDGYLGTNGLLPLLKRHDPRQLFHEPDRPWSGRTVVPCITPSILPRPLDPLPNYRCGFGRVQ